MAKRIDKLPTRLQLGHKYTGPEFFGCINTGTRPCICYSRLLVDNAIANKGFHYAVGPEDHITESIILLLLGKTTHKTKHWPSFQGRKNRNLEVKFFRTENAARKHFLMLVKLRNNKNKQVQQSYMQAKQQSQSPDTSIALQGLLSLSDF